MKESNSFDVEAYVDAASATIGLAIPPELRPAVVANFKQIAETASVVMSFPVDDDVDPALVFRP